MAMKKETVTTIDQYISGFPQPVQKMLQSLRKTIRKAAPGAEETIKYQMPTFMLYGNLVHFAAYKNHIGFYPVPRGVETFKEALDRYEGSKNTVRFPLDQPLPLKLVAQIVQYRVAKNKEKWHTGKKAPAAAKNKTMICKNGHTYVKSTDCPVCPVCEKIAKPKEGFLALLSAPARRALENKGIHTLEMLAVYSEAEILSLHGMGETSIPKLRSLLETEGLTFKK